MRDMSNQVEVRGEQRQRDDRLVEVDADLLLDAPAGRARSGRPTRRASRSGSGRDRGSDGEPGNVGGYVFDALGAAVAERLLCGCDHREGHRLEGLLALAGGDRNRYFPGEVGRLASPGSAFSTCPAGSACCAEAGAGRI